MHKFSFINYAGNKKAIIEDIFSVLPFDLSYDSLTWREPFFGSGGAYCNVPVVFAEYKCSDVFPFVIEFINKNYSEEELADFYDRIHQQYNLKESKDDYYAYRDFWNKNQEHDDKLRTMGFILLVNACINGLCRFSVNGFNQSCGARTTKRDDFILAMSHIRPNSVFRVQDFRKTQTGKNVFLYLDPPYYGTGAVVEQLSPFFTWGRKEDDDVLSLIEQQNQCGGIFVLSTIDESYLASNLKGFRKEKIDKKYKVTPHKFKSKDYVEIMVTNT